MRRILLAILLVVSLFGLVRAKEEAGDAAEEARKEVLKIENDKIPILVAGGSGAADWWASHNDEDMAYTSAKGTLSKAQVMEEWRSGSRNLLSNKQYDFRVRIYQKGTLAVVTYLGDTARKNPAGGADLTTHSATTNVWIKQDGKWVRVVHHVTPLRAE
jgi:uncharacterized protein DUF4440